eukprot:5884202-Heterocapsa_arctica.AAC.1
MQAECEALSISKNSARRAIRTFLRAGVARYRGQKLDTRARLAHCFSEDAIRQEEELLRANEHRLLIQSSSRALQFDGNHSAPVKLTELQVAVYNCRSLRRTGRLNQILTKARVCSLDIFALVGTRWQGGYSEFEMQGY